MAVPSYTTDLIDWIADTDITAWAELTNMLNGGAPDEADTESALQGTNSVSQITNTVALFSMCRILAASVTLASGNVFLVWHCHSVATALLNYANGGLRLCVATTVGDWKCWAVGGNDVAPYPYGNWINNAVDPTITGEYTLGTPPAALTFFGVGSAGILSQAVARGQPHKVDIIRYGRAEARINGGDITNGYAIFSGFAAVNDATTARWGLIQATDGGYLWKGLMTLGYTSAVDFRDTNKTILIQDTRKVYSTFNKIEIRQATSRVDWTGITFACLAPSTTASKGDFQMIDAATVNISACSFVDMATFIFLSSASVTNSSFRRTGQITTGGATFSGCTIDRNTAASAMLAATPANAALISSTAFTSDGTGHAIEITGTAANMTLTGNTYTGYAASDGTTGNEVVYVNIATGSMNLTISGGNVPTVRTAGCTVTVISGAVTVSVNVKNSSGTNIQNARVFVKASNNTGPFPFEEAVTIANSGTTATVTHTDGTHGMATNDKVVISGASLEANNGIFSITSTGTATYTYTMGSTPGSSPTGTIISTFVAIGAANGTGGLTDANGDITMSRVFPSNQPITGWVRRATSGTLTITATSGSGTVATLTFATQGSTPFPAGTIIKVTGLTPDGYNGVYVSTGGSTSTVTYASTTTGSMTVAGTVANHLYKTSIISGTALAASGFSTTVLMISDE